MDKGDVVFGALVVAILAGIVGGLIGLVALVTWVVKTVWGS